MTGILQSDMTGGMRRLAALLGIDGERDVAGRPLSDDQLVSALQTLGFTAEDSGELQILIDRESRRQWLSALPAAVLAQTGQPVTIPVRTSDPASARVSIVGASDLHAAARLAPTITGTHTVTVGGASEVRHEYIATAPAQEPGIAEVRCEAAGTVSRAPLIVSEPAVQPSARGFRLHLASARMSRSWGVGDFADLRDIAVQAAEVGAESIVTAPVTASSGYSPFDVESRCALDPLYISITDTPEYATAQSATRQAVRALGIDLLESSSRNEPMNPQLVRDRKLRSLLALYEVPVRTSRQAEFARFCAQAGPGLRGWAVYRAMLMDASVPASSGSREVHIFKEEREDLIDFWLWVQFIAREQFTAAVSAPTRLGYGLRVAVQVPQAGHVDAWALPQTVISLDEGQRPWMRGVFADAVAAGSAIDALADTVFLLAGADLSAGDDCECVPGGDADIPITEPAVPAIMGALANRYGGRGVLDGPLGEFAAIMGDSRPRGELPWRVPVCENGRKPITSRSLAEHLKRWGASAGTIGSHDGDS
ncbi:4-alpha-glucanotransferase [Brevibacterium sp. HMSC07C04]|uniref:4-alpha-glucanotransferase n=1 Tax=Brevibacterium sp. HMSC07C04 TaxID=1581130 RepID=UPI0008A35530|nr:4-alpha-glucanotransferase [Brevibacterium sp. HMSC07C04]